MTTLFWHIINKLGSKYKPKIIVLFFLSILAGFMEVFGIALIFPLISLMGNPDLVNTNGNLNWFYTFFDLNDPKHLLYIIAGLIGAIFVIKNIFMIWYKYFELRILRNWRNNICDNVMESYLKAPYIYHLKKSSYKMINTLSSTVSYVLYSYIYACFSLVSNVIIVAMLIIFLLYHFLVPTLISGSVLGLMTYIQARAMRKYTKDVSDNINEARAVNLNVLTQGIAAIKETKSYVREKFFLKSYETSNKTITGLDNKLAFLQNLPPYISEIVLVITIITMSCLVMAQSFTPVGGMISLAILAAVSFRIAPLINRTLYFYTEIRAAFGAAKEFTDEIKELEDAENEHFSKNVEALTLKNNLHLKNVNFQYDENSPALNNINLNVPQGKFIGIIGTSGAGKTTLVDIILGLIRPNSGEYFVDDIPIDNPDRLRSLRMATGYVSQNPYIFNSTVRENVAFGINSNDIDDKKVTKALQMAKIDDLFREKEDYLYYEIGDNGKSLSGGQRQRLAIARALYVDPDIIVLDEATSSLDVETEHSITQIINGMKGHKTIIAIAHRLSTLKECDELILMEAGKILDTGTFEDLEKRQKSFARLLTLSNINVSNKTSPI